MIKCMVNTVPYDFIMNQMFVQGGSIKHINAFNQLGVEVPSNKNLANELAIAVAKTNAMKTRYSTINI